MFWKNFNRTCEKNDKIVGITAAMPHGTGLSHLMDQIPERFSMWE